MNAKQAVELSLQFMHTFNNPGDMPKKVREVAKAIRKAVNAEKTETQPTPVTDTERKAYEDEIKELNSRVMALEQRNLVLATKSTRYVRLIIALKDELKTFKSRYGVSKAA